MAGFAVGVAEKSRLITGETIAPGDVLLGLPSTGVHSNGFSLVRKICFDHQKFTVDTHVPELGMTVGEELLTPTRLYPKVCLPLIENYQIKGMVHITGGGFYDNIPRVLPAGCGAVVNVENWPRPEIFSLLQQWGQVAWPEMYRTFNMGIGMILVVSEQTAPLVQRALAEQNEICYRIGRVVTGDQTVQLKGGVFGA